MGNSHHFGSEDLSSGSGPFVVTGDSVGRPVEIDTAEVTAVPNFYALRVQKDGFWRIAAVDTRYGAGMKFRAAAALPDGTIRLEIRSLGAQWRTRTAILDPRSNLWSTACTHVLPGQGAVITTATGRFGTGSEVTLTRVRNNLEGSEVWRAEATMRLVDGGDAPVRQTSGTVRFSNGDTGSFRTTLNAIGAGTSEFEYGSVTVMPLPNPSGKTVTRLPDGSVRVVVDTPLPFHAGKRVDTTVTKETPQADGSARHEIHQNHEVFDANTGRWTSSGSDYVTTTRDIPSSEISGGQVDTQIDRQGTERDTQGNKTEVHEIITLGPNGEHSEIWHRDKPDGTHETQIISSSGGGVGTRETIVVDKNGNTVSDKDDDVEIDQKGDWGPKTVGSPEPGSSGSSRDPDPDPDPDSEHPSTGEESESDDTGDGGFGDDTGPPGLGWDGAQDSPRHFLPDGSVDDGTAGWDGQLDNLGAGMSIFLADAILHAWNRPGGAEGLGEDVTGVTPPIEVDLSTITPHSVADPEGNWGDFTNPKAHLELLDSIRLDAQKLGAPDVHIGSLNSLGSILANSTLVQSAQISSLA